MSTPKRYTLCVDFDGVLHSYDGKWGGHDVIEGEPVPGAIEWIEQITEDFDLAILTTRTFTIEGASAVRAWLRRYVSPEAMVFVKCVSHKPPALLYIDDRAWRFDGSNWPSREDVHRAIPWWKR